MRCYGRRTRFLLATVYDCVAGAFMGREYERKLGMDKQGTSA